MAELRIISEYTTPTFDVKVKASSLDFGSNVNVEKTPNANSGDLVEVQTKAYENPTYKIDNIHLSDGVSFLSVYQMMLLSKHKYDGSNPIKMVLKYGPSIGETAFTAFGDLSSTEIPVVVENFNLKFDTTDSRDARIPMGSLELVETL